MQVPRIMRRINRLVTNPLVGTIAGLLPPLAIVHHSGRKSGRPYRTPVAAFHAEAGFLIPLPYGTDTDWCLNALEAGRCTLETAGHKIEAENPRILEPEAAIPLLPALLQSGLRAASLPGYLLLDRSQAD